MSNEVRAALILMLKDELSAGLARAGVNTSKFSGGVESLSAELSQGLAASTAKVDARLEQLNSSIATSAGQTDRLSTAIEKLNAEMLEAQTRAKRDQLDKQATAEKGNKLAGTMGKVKAGFAAAAGAAVILGGGLKIIKGQADEMGRSELSDSIDNATGSFKDMFSVMLDLNVAGRDTITWISDGINSIATITKAISAYTLAIQAHLGVITWEEAGTKAAALANNNLTDSLRDQNTLIGRNVKAVKEATKATNEWAEARKKEANARRVDNINKYNQEMQSRREQEAQTLVSIALSEADRLEDAEREKINALAEIDQKAADGRLEIEQQYQDQLADIKDKGSEEIEDAIRRGDARALADAMKASTKELKEAEKGRDKELAALKKDEDEQRRALDKAMKDAEADARRSYERQLRDLAISQANITSKNIANRVAEKLGLTNYLRDIEKVWTDHYKKLAEIGKPPNPSTSATVYVPPGGGSGGGTGLTGPTMLAPTRATAGAAAPAPATNTRGGVAATNSGKVVLELRGPAEVKEMFRGMMRDWFTEEVAAV